MKYGMDFELLSLSKLNLDGTLRSLCLGTWHGGRRLDTLNHPTKNHLRKTIRRWRTLPRLCRRPWKEPRPPETRRNIANQDNN